MDKSSVNLIGRALLVLIWAFAQRGGGEPLPGGAAPLTETGDFAAKMVAGIHQFLDREIEASSKPVPSNPLRSSEAAMARAIEHLREVIGATHQRIEFTDLQFIDSVNKPEGKVETALFMAYRVRWPVLDGVDAEGIYLNPTGGARACVVAIPDADGTPEQICGFVKDFPVQQQFARALAENGCAVLVPAILSRIDELSGNPKLNKFTNQPHREFIYRMAYELGLHPIGFEVEKVLSAIDWFARDRGKSFPIGIAGYGEGGLIAIYASALETGASSTIVSGYWESARTMWKEPIYRNVWALHNSSIRKNVGGFVDSHRYNRFIIEACRPPIVSGPPASREGRSGAAPGTTDVEDTQMPPGDYEGYRALHRTAEDAIGSINHPGYPSAGDAFSSGGLAQFLLALNRKLDANFRPQPIGAPLQVDVNWDPKDRERRQFNQLVDYLQKAMRASATDRAELWKDVRPKAKEMTPEQWDASTEALRKKFADEVIGRFDNPKLPPNPRMRVEYDNPKWTGYETMLDVWPGVFAYGVLLLPKDLKPGERRPVVVCQHGLEGRPKDVIEPNDIYKSFAARLADRGFIVYAPQNPYIGGDNFRSIQRKANPLGKSLFSIILGQHEQLLNWLETLRFVDAKRIGFYGLSYGGKTAMRIPAIERRYCLSICSADFNDWIQKNVSYDSPYSYLYTGEYEMFEFNLARTFNYAEMAWLIAPRPFMVERGHYDGVAPDEWVAAEYAKVKFLYDELKIGDRTEMEVFLGPHSINGVGTFKFLHKHLNWPEPQEAASQ